MNMIKYTTVPLILALLFVMGSCRQMPRSGSYVVKKEIARIDSSSAQRMAQSQQNRGNGNNRNGRTPKIPTPFNLTTTADGRVLFFIGAITVKNRNLTIYVWDNGAEDGDIISLFVNNSPVISNFTLKKAKHQLQATISDGDSELYLHAHNLGLYPPNTAALEVWDGNQKHYVYLSSNLQSSQGIKIKLK